MELHKPFVEDTRFAENNWTRKGSNWCYDLKGLVDDRIVVVQPIDLKGLTNLRTFIQVGSINRPLRKYENTGITEAVSFERPSPEALTSSLLTTSMLVINALLFKYGTYTVPTINRLINGKVCSLRVFGSFDNEDQLHSYTDSLYSLYNSPESVAANLCFDSNNLHNDVWWDCANHVLISFDRNFLTHAVEHLKVSAANCK